MNPNKDEMIEGVKEFAQCLACQTIIKDRETGIVCTSCDHMVCKECFNQYKRKDIACMLCQKENYQKRQVSRSEMLSIQSFVYKCDSNIPGCSNLVLKHQDYIQHLKDHQDGAIPQKCPLTCGQLLTNQQLYIHLIKIDECNNLVEINDLICQNQNLNCKNCGEKVLVRKLRIHKCFEDEINILMNKKISNLLDEQKQKAQYLLDEQNLKFEQILIQKEQENENLKKQYKQELKQSQNEINHLKKLNFELEEINKKVNKPNFQNLQLKEQFEQFQIQNKQNYIPKLNKPEEYINNKETLEDIQYFFNKPPSGNKGFKPNKNCLKLWHMLGPLNIKKLVQDEFLYLKPQNRKYSLIQPYDFTKKISKIKSQIQTSILGIGYVLYQGQIHQIPSFMNSRSSKNSIINCHGIGRFIDKEGNIIEGQLQYNYIRGWCRYIKYDSYRKQYIQKVGWKNVSCDEDSLFHTFQYDLNQNNEFIINEQSFTNNSNNFSYRDKYDWENDEEYDYEKSQMYQKFKKIDIKDYYISPKQPKI